MIKVIGNLFPYLIRVRKSTHATHNPEYVIICCIHVHSRGQVGAHRIVADRQEQGSVINAG